MSPDINTTWLGMVGPGIQHLGVNNSAWSDHTDIRPSMMELLGLKDDYVHDGRVLFEVIDDSALPPVIRANRSFFTRLAQVYKQIDASVGALGLATLRVFTIALESNAPNDSTYTQKENQLQTITNQRNILAGQIIAVLEAAEFGSGNSSSPLFSHQYIQSLIARSSALLAQAESLVKKP